MLNMLSPFVTQYSSLSKLPQLHEAPSCSLLKNRTWSRRLKSLRLLLTTSMVIDPVKELMSTGRSHILPLLPATRVPYGELPDRSLAHLCLLVTGLVNLPKPWQSGGVASFTQGYFRRQSGGHNYPHGKRLGAHKADVDGPGLCK